MKNSTSCAIIRDILPTYLDGLTSDASNKIIESHIEECQECRKLLANMREPQIDAEQIQDEEIEIDFLRKNRKHSKIVIGAAVLIAAISIIVGLLVPEFTRHELSYDDAQLELAVGDVINGDKNVEDGLLSVTARTSGTYGISNIDFSEKDGVVTVKVTGAKEKIWTSSVYETKYNAEKQIKEVRYGNNTIWKDGVTASDDTIKIFKTAHPYVGDHIKNGQTLSALDVFNQLGEYTLELQTSDEPYGMTIELKKEIDIENEKYFEKFMGYVSCNCLAVIDNLSYVTFKYDSADGAKDVTWDIEKAEQLLGKDVKAYGKSEIALEILKWNYYTNE